MYKLLQGCLSGCFSKLHVDIGRLFIICDDYGFLQTEKFKYNYNNTIAFTCDMMFYSCLCPTTVEFKSVYDIKFYQIMLPLE